MISFSGGPGFCQLVSNAEKYEADTKEDHQRTHGNAFVVDVQAKEIQCDTVGCLADHRHQGSATKEAPLPQMSIRP